MRFAAALAVAIALLSGCVRTRVHAELPAVLAADEASAAALQTAVRKATGQQVVLAADALTRSNVLIVEPARLEGRETRPPEHFELFVSGSVCLLRRNATGERLPLHGARCRKLSE